ncbi:MAG: hypothetical protein Q7R88_02610 [bacterium]|nr:hypothetical protein [bacterium]
MTDILPAILPKNFAELQEKLGRVKGLADGVQIDICDGRFVPSKTWPYVFSSSPPSRGGVPSPRGGVVGEAIAEKDPNFQAIVNEKEGFPFWDSFDFEFDLMVHEPEGVIGDYVKAGASRIVLHVESTKVLSEIIHEWQHSVILSLAASIETPLSVFADFAHHVKDFQLMGIAKIGAQGQAFDERVIERVRELKKLYPEHTITVDGGVSLETALSLLDAGATRLVVGSALFKSENIADTIEQLKHCDAASTRGEN